MKYLTFSNKNQTEFDIAFLVPRLNSAEICKYYIDPYLSSERDRILAYDLYKEPKRTPVKTQREYLETLLPILMDLKVKYLVVCDGEYFKTLTGKGTVETSSGYVLDAVVGGFKVIYCPNFSQVFYDPDKVKYKIDQSLTALNDFMKGTYTDPGDSIIKFAAYPSSVESIEAWLQRLLDMKVPLTCDIEGFGLKHWESGIGTITFCWNQHEGIAFPVDLGENPKAVRALLKDFFIKFKQKMIWHNITFDVYVLVYQLFMKDLLDTEGLLHGMDILLRNWDDTKLITYLATNSCAGNKLGLKAQAQEYAGNYAVEDIKDIRSIPLDQLLEYNLVDGLSTWYVHTKHYQTMIQDQQEDIYSTLFKDAVLDIIQMQLTGLPVDMEEVKKVQIELQQNSDNSVAAMMSSPIIGNFIYERNVRYVAKKNASYKKKRITIADVDEGFNPNSAPQLQELLYDPQFMNFPVIDLTDSKLPATGKETLEKLMNHTADPDELAFLKALCDYKDVTIILTTFIPALLAAPLAPDGWHYLFGNFNLGGTISGRLSSNNPNLQNLPSSGKDKAKAIIAKMIKRCIKAPKGYLFVGLDFSSLEDRISAVTTKDPQKLKVYTDGFDGHCLRAYAYFGDQMPDIDPRVVDSINSIAEKYKPLRQKSKNPTFALTYQGTYITLMANCGFSEQLAKDIEKRYHELYQVSDKWVDDKLQQATKDGYVTCAFGLRVRTPLLHQVILNTKRTPFEAAAEGRTAGNALGQSWCLLNSRAASEFMGKVRKSKYRTKIRPCAHIHDAQYYLIPDDMEIIMYMNEHLVKAVEWQDHPDIYHDDVKLGGELSIFYPNWACEMVIPNKATETEISKIAEEHYHKYAEAA